MAMRGWPVLQPGQVLRELKNATMGPDDSDHTGDPTQRRRADNHNSQAQLAAARGRQQCSHPRGHVAVMHAKHARQCRHGKRAPRNRMRTSAARATPRAATRRSPTSAAAPSSAHRSTLRRTARATGRSNGFAAAEASGDSNKKMMSVAQMRSLVGQQDAALIRCQRAEHRTGQDNASAGRRDRVRHRLVSIDHDKGRNRGGQPQRHGSRLTRATHHGEGPQCAAEEQRHDDKAAANPATGRISLPGIVVDQ